MEECEWTRYGRVAKKSITSLKSKILNYNNNANPTLIHNIQSISSIDRFVKYTYKTNLNSITNIVKSFNNMYEDKSKMRYDSYQYVKTNGIEDFAVFKNENEYKKGLAFYAKPYQKYIKDKNGTIYQYQMPAYVMQSITNAIHDKVSEWKEENGVKHIIVRDQEPKPVMSENQWTFKDAVLANDKLQSSAWEMFVGEGLFKAIDYPHYTESYYA